MSELRLLLRIHGQVTVHQRTDGEGLSKFACTVLWVNLYH